MKQTIPSLMISAAFAAISLCALAEPAVAADDNQLVGSWVGTVDIPSQPQERTLTTYNAGGTVVATTSSPTDSEQHGVWVRREGGGFATTLLAFSRDTSGNVTGMVRIRFLTTLSEDGNSSSGTTEADIMDLSGNVVFVVTGVTHAEKRITVGAANMSGTAPALNASVKAGPGTAGILAGGTLTTTPGTVVTQVDLDASGSSPQMSVTYLYEYVGGLQPAILHSPTSPTATIQLVSGPGTYMLRLTVIDSRGSRSAPLPITIVRSL